MPLTLKIGTVHPHPFYTVVPCGILISMEMSPSPSLVFVWDIMLKVFHPEEFCENQQHPAKVLNSEFHTCQHSKPHLQNCLINSQEILHRLSKGVDIVNQKWNRKYDLLIFRYGPWFPRIRSFLGHTVIILCAPTAHTPYIWIKQSIWFIVYTVFFVDKILSLFCRIQGTHQHLWSCVIYWGHEFGGFVTFSHS